MSSSHVNGEEYEELLARVNLRMSAAQYFSDTAAFETSQKLSEKLAARLAFLMSGGYNTLEGIYAQMIMAGDNITAGLNPTRPECMCADAHIMLNFLYCILNVPEITVFENGMDNDTPSAEEGEAWERYPEYPAVVKNAFTIYHEKYSPAGYDEDLYILLNILGGVKGVVDRLKAMEDDYEDDKQELRKINELHADECYLCSELWQITAEENGFEI